MMSTGIIFMIKLKLNMRGKDVIFFKSTLAWILISGSVVFNL